jgi:hypothetical protein
MRCWKPKHTARFSTMVLAYSSCSFSSRSNCYVLFETHMKSLGTATCLDTHRIASHRIALFVMHLSKDLSIRDILVGVLNSRVVARMDSQIC